MKMLTVEGVVSDNEQSSWWQSGAIFFSNLHIRMYYILYYKLSIEEYIENMIWTVKYVNFII